MPYPRSDMLRPSKVFLCFASAGMVLFGYTVEGFHTFVYSVPLGLESQPVDEVFFRLNRKDPIRWSPNPKFSFSGELSPSSFRASKKAQ